MSEVFYQGPKRTVVWAADESGRIHGKEYFEGLPTKDRAKLAALFERMGDHGEIRNRERFRHEEDGLYCFKTFKRRLMCFFDGRLIVITHGFNKKKDRLDRNQLDRGQRIRRHYQSNKQGR